jgi:hypothetical protein
MGALLTLTEFSRASGIKRKTVANRVLQGRDHLTGKRPLVRPGGFQGPPVRYEKRSESTSDIELGKSYFRDWPLVAAVG